MLGLSLHFVKCVTSATVATIMLGCCWRLQLHNNISLDVLRGTTYKTFDDGRSDRYLNDLYVNEASSDYNSLD